MNNVFKKNQSQKPPEPPKHTLQQQITMLEEKLTKGRQQALQQTIAMKQETNGLRQDVSMIIETVRALVELVGLEEVNQKVSENRIKDLLAQDEGRRTRLLEMIESGRIEEETVVRGATPATPETPGDPGSYIASCEFDPDAADDADPIPGSYNFMPIGTMAPPDLAMKFIGKTTGDEIEVPWNGPEEKKPKKLGRIVILGIFKPLPVAPAQPAPEVPETTGEAPPAAEQAAAQG